MNTIESYYPNQSSLLMPACALVRQMLFRSKKDARRYWILLSLFIGMGLIASLGLLLYNNPVPVDSPSFIPVVTRRFVAIVAMFIAALCHSLSTVAFQSITSNRIITPSLLGYESLYSFIQTGTLFFFGAGALVGFSGMEAFFLQVSPDDRDEPSFVWVVTVGEIWKSASDASRRNHHRRRSEFRLRLYETLALPF